MKLIIIILSKVLVIDTKLEKKMKIRYLHTMVRVKDLEKSIAFYRLIGLREIKRNENDVGRFTLVFLAPDGQHECPLELTFNWMTTMGSRQTADILAI